MAVKAVEDQVTEMLLERESIGYRALFQKVWDYPRGCMEGKFDFLAWVMGVRKDQLHKYVDHIEVTLTPAVKQAPHFTAWSQLYELVYTTTGRRVTYNLTLDMGARIRPGKCKAILVLGPRAPRRKKYSDTLSEDLQFRDYSDQSRYYRSAPSEREFVWPMVGWHVAGEVKEGGR